MLETSPIMCEGAIPARALLERHRTLRAARPQRSFLEQRNPSHGALSPTPGEGAPLKVQWRVQAGQTQDWWGGAVGRGSWVGSPPHILHLVFLAVGWVTRREPQGLVPESPWPARPDWLCEKNLGRSRDKAQAPSQKPKGAFLKCPFPATPQ